MVGDQNDQGRTEQTQYWLDHISRRCGYGTHPSKRRDANPVAVCVMTIGRGVEAVTVNESSDLSIRAVCFSYRKDLSDGADKQSHKSAEVGDGASVLQVRS